MLTKGTRVKIKEDLTEDETKIDEYFLRNLRGKETTILKGKDAFTLEISKDRFVFEEDWLEVIED